MFIQYSTSSFLTILINRQTLGGFCSVDEEKIHFL